jgi:hypothetical protein
VPRLVLLEDDGREVFRGEISRENFAVMIRVLAPHRKTLQKAATVVRAVRELFQVASQPPPRRVAAAPRSNAKRGGRA